MSDPLERAIEVALEPGTFVGYRRSYGFVQDLEEVRERVVGPPGSPAPGAPRPRPER